MFVVVGAVAVAVFRPQGAATLLLFLAALASQPAACNWAAVRFICMCLCFLALLFCWFCNCLTEIGWERILYVLHGKMNLNAWIQNVTWTKTLCKEFLYNYYVLFFRFFAFRFSFFGSSTLVRIYMYGWWGRGRYGYLTWAMGGKTASKPFAAHLPRTYVTNPIYI